MSMSDPIADLITRIRNASVAAHDIVSVPASKLKGAVLEVLKKEGYIKDYTKREDGKQGILDIQLKQLEKGVQVIHEIKRVSKPSRRIYMDCDSIKRFKGGLGISIFSTSKGVMSDRNAKKEGVGGELLLTVW